MSTVIELEHEMVKLHEENAKLKARLNELLNGKWIEKDREQKLWELYRDSRKQFYLQGTDSVIQGNPDTNEAAFINASEALAVWEAEAPEILATKKGERNALGAAITHLKHFEQNIDRALDELEGE